MSFLKTHKYSWEILRLALIFSTLMSVFLLVNQAQLQKWSLVSVNDTLDVSDELSSQIYDIECYTLNALSFPSYIAITVAAFNAGRNDRLTVPIRALAVFEHVFKFISTLLMSGALFVKKTPINFPSWFSDWAWYLYKMGNKYDLQDISQYYQLMISINRFLAVSFDGFYFCYTLKWPSFQVAIPVFLRVGSEFIVDLLLSWNLSNDLLFTAAHWTPYIIGFALDLETRQKLKKLKKNGKVSRAERLLMLQMMINSFYTYFDQLISNSLITVLGLFFGEDLMSTITTFIITIQITIFMLGSSIMNAIFLRKTKDSLKEEGISSNKSLFSVKKSNRIRNISIQISRLQK